MLVPLFAGIQKESFSAAVKVDEPGRTKCLAPGGPCFYFHCRPVLEDYAKAVFLLMLMSPWLYHRWRKRILWGKKEALYL